MNISPSFGQSRRSVPNLILSSFVIALALRLIACGGSSSSPPPPPPPPSISSISPSSVAAGAPGFTLTVNGSNFASDAVVLWNGSSRTTTFVSSTQLTAAIPASDVAAPGMGQVTVFNPTSNPVTSSNALTFSIVNPLPAPTSLSPSSVQAGAAPFTLTVDGSAFLPKATVQWNGASRTTTFVSNARLTAPVFAGDVATPGTAQITVVNPMPGGGSSSALTFTIDPLTNNPTPSITSLSDTSAPAGWPGFPLTVNGSGFVAASAGQFNGLNHPTTVFSSSLLKAAIPASDLATAGNAQVTVFNSSPGGGSSNAVAFTIKSVPAGAVGTIERSSLATDLTEADKGSRGASISADGRFVVFSSDATNLVSGDTNGFTDVFLRDTCINASPGCVPSTVRVSVASDGTESNGFSGEASISANGRFVAFVSDATNLVPGDTNHFPDVFVRDTCFGAPAGCTPGTTRVSLNSDGSQILLENHEPTLSADGRFVAFASGISGYYYYSSDNFDVLVRDTCVGAPSGCKPSTTHVAVANDGTAGNGSSDLPAISSSGRFVAFRSAATNLVAGDTNKVADVFVHDTCFGAPAGCTPSTVRVSVASDGTEADRASGGPTISADGRFIAFTSIATNLVTGDTNSSQDVFVRDTCSGAASGCKPSTFRVSVSSDGTQADSNSDSPAISADGRFVAFSSSATNLVANDTNKLSDVFVRDTCFGAPAGCTPGTVRVSLAQDGTQANGDSIRPAINGNGGFVVFESAASNLAPGDTNTATDIFVARTGFNPSTASSSLASSAAAKHPVVAAEAKLNAAVFAPPRSTNLQQSVLRNHRSRRIAP